MPARISPDLPPRRSTILGGATAALVVTSGLGLQADLLPHAPLVPEEAELARLTRIRSLMAGSTQEHPNDVRIIFYGQSITLAPWWKEVASGLEAAYPTVHFQFENRAISGFIDAYLERTAPADLIPRNPDLVILHAFGDGFPMADLIREVRAATTTEVLLQQDYVLGGESLEPVTNLDAIPYSDNARFRNYISLPLAANQTGSCLARIHDPWKDYCRTNHVDPLSLLNPDGLHPAPDSDHLLGELTLAYLLPYGRAATIDPWNCPQVQTLNLDRDPVWHDGELVCDVTGRTVELGFDHVPYADVQVWIDGTRPSSHPELYAFTRPSYTYYNTWPTISRVGSQAPLLEETWTFTPFNVAPNGIDFSFRVSGSVTGEDGVGTNTERFVSNSGRVVIEPFDHWLGRTVLYGGGPIPDGFTASWAAVLNGADAVPTTLRPSAQVRGNCVVLAHRVVGGHASGDAHHHAGPGGAVSFSSSFQSCGCGTHSGNRGASPSTHRSIDCALEGGRALAHLVAGSRLDPAIHHRARDRCCVGGVSGGADPERDRSSTDDARGFRRPGIFPPDTNDAVAFSGDPTRERKTARQLAGPSWDQSGSESGGRRYSSLSAETPGRGMPSRNSRLAPPPVLAKVTLSPRPALLIALTESPPPMIDLAPEVCVAATSACATAWVPAAKRASSNIPMGPFQRTVLAPAITLA